jgi:hypothetical protein
LFVWGGGRLRAYPDIPVAVASGPERTFVHGAANGGSEPNPTDAASPLKVCFA